MRHLPSFPYTCLYSDPTVQFTNESKINTVYHLKLEIWRCIQIQPVISESDAYVFRIRELFPKLVILDSHGCRDTATNRLNLYDPAFDLYIPYAFTPNGDGKNGNLSNQKASTLKILKCIFLTIGVYSCCIHGYYKGWDGSIVEGKLRGRYIRV